MGRRSGVRLRTRKLIGRITYEPAKHKNKYVKSLRRDLATRPFPKPPEPPKQDPALTFGCMNVNGLGQESHWAVTQIIDTHQIDVSNNLENVATLRFIYQRS